MAYASSILREEAEALRLEDVQKHLQLDGWVRDADASWQTAGVYRKGAEELVLPATRSVVDYAARMADVVRAISESEDRSPRAVLAVLLRPPSTDAIRLREVSPLTTQGFIPIQEGVRLITGGFDSLLAVAHSACDPVGFHPRLGVRRATDLVDQCRLGAERGSFIVTILVPVPLAIQLAFDPAVGTEIEDEPFPRQVTRLFMSALGVVRSSLDVGGPERLLHEARSGVSANLCGALAEMLPRSDQAHVEITADWARTRRPAPASVPSRVTFRSGEHLTLDSVSARLRERYEPEPVELVGTIVFLAGDTTGLFGEQSQSFSGQVRLRSSLLDQQVQIKLGPADFIEAVEAYRLGSRVRVSGTIRRSGQTIELQRPLGLKRIAPVAD